MIITYQENNPNLLAAAGIAIFQPLVSNLVGIPSMVPKKNYFSFTTLTIAEILSKLDDCPDSYVVLPQRNQAQQQITNNNFGKIRF